jgi:hypothetical protein
MQRLFGKGNLAGHSAREEAGMGDGLRSARFAVTGYSRRERMINRS